MKTWDDERFFKYTRMSQMAFNRLISYIKPQITKQPRSDGITPKERLIITLQYLSQGTSMQGLAWNFHVGLTTVHQIVLN
ncbi:hypothetical protein NQ318_005031 [Aromia moschata]|uniref:Transposase Helix-turn-helix domain-containing protein n=1 Tax=Aromia moschata TaxID=1265417 RepID=A0AAV8Y9K4_9CUCU|nr:hypothetical protein NQ318_005031 [Aromia moschata]